MKIPPCVCLLVLALNMTGLWGCVHEAGPEKSQKELNEQLARNPLVNPGAVPQTLDPAPRNTTTESKDSSAPPVPSTVASINSMATNAPPQHGTAPIRQALTQQNVNSPVGPSTRTLFGEFSGVKTKWEEMKQQLLNQLKKQEQQTKELKVKLQLIAQVAQHVNFTTKAYLGPQDMLLAEFTIENRTPYAIKDISITCDQIAPTQAIIQTHVETIYDIINPTTRSTFVPLFFGRKHRQTQSLQCQITNFTVHNP